MTRTARSTLALCTAGLLFFLFTWWSEPGRPMVSWITRDIGSVADPPEPGEVPSARWLTQAHRYGWYAASSDQLNYAREARALARGELPGSHWDYERQRLKPGHHPEELSDYAYPLGYPAIGAPFILLGLKGDPFLVPNGLMFVAILLVAGVLAGRILTRPWNWAYVGVLAVATPLTRLVAKPWNTTTTLLAVLVALWVSSETSDSWGRAAMVAGAFALCFSSRLIDVVWPVSILVISWAVQRHIPRRIAIVTGVTLVVMAGIVMWTQHEVFGNAFRTPYHYHYEGAGIGPDQFAIGRIPRQAWEVLVSGLHSDGTRPVGAPALLRESPWLVLGPVGLLLVRRRRPDLFRWLAGPVVVSVIASALYFAYVDGGGNHLEYGVHRFTVAWLPLWALLAVMAIPGSVAPAAGSREMAP